MLIGARIIAPLRVLDLDDLRTKIRKCLSAGRPCNDAREIHNQQAVQGRRRVLCSRQTVREWQFGSHGEAFPCILASAFATLGSIGAGSQGLPTCPWSHAGLRATRIGAGARRRRLGPSQETKKARWPVATGLNNLISEV